MPAHDWTRVDAGIFHAFHLAWIGELQKALNNGLLPPDYYALGEQVAAGGNPDVIALQETSGTPDPLNGTPPANPGASTGGVALLTAPPRVRLTARAEQEHYTGRQRQLVIRHISNHRVVALLELVSAGNKSSEYSWQTFIDKALGTLRQGVHLLICDLHPPTPRDPQGVHGSLWESLTGETYEQPGDARLTLVSYAAGAIKTAYVEPLAVGQPLTAMPLYLTEGGYIETPLEPTYQAAYAGVPRFYRQRLEAG